MENDIAQDYKANITNTIYFGSPKEDVLNNRNLDHILDNMIKKSIEDQNGLFIRYLQQNCHDLLDYMYSNLNVMIAYLNNNYQQYYNSYYYQIQFIKKLLYDETAQNSITQEEADKILQFIQDNNFNKCLVSLSPRMLLRNETPFILQPGLYGGTYVIMDENILVSLQTWSQLDIRLFSGENTDDKTLVSMYVIIPSRKDTYDVREIYYIVNFQSKVNSIRQKDDSKKYHIWFMQEMLQVNLRHDKHMIDGTDGKRIMKHKLFLEWRYKDFNTGTFQSILNDDTAISIQNMREYILSQQTLSNGTKLFDEYKHYDSNGNPITPKQYYQVCPYYDIKLLKEDTNISKFTDDSYNIFFHHPLFSYEESEKQNSICHRFLYNVVKSTSADGTEVITPLFVKCVETKDLNTNDDTDDSEHVFSVEIDQEDEFWMNCDVETYDIYAWEEEVQEDTQKSQNEQLLQNQQIVQKIQDSQIIQKILQKIIQKHNIEQ